MNADWLWWCLWVCFCLSCPVDAATDSTDAQVMAEMAKAVKFDSTWTGNDPCSGWTGVSCSKTKVTGINIQGKNLEGTLPADFNKLSALNSINMHRNLLSGPLPSFSGLSNLVSVSLGSNAFDSIPADFFHGLTSLQTFAIDDNSLLAPWSIPDDLASAVALTSFSANNASIVGELPEFLGVGAALQTLKLAYNSLKGLIPTSFNASSNLRVLWLNYQKVKLPGGSNLTLGGSILTVGAMSQLTQVWLHGNAFTGPVPDFKSASLFDLQLQDNMLTGPVPESLLSFTSLNISLRNNELQGPYPNFKTNPQPDTTRNNFCTSVPGTPCDCRVNALLSFAEGLGYPYAIANAWTGNDPCAQWLHVTCVGGNVSTLIVANQQLIGTISPALSGLTSLTQVILSGNNLTGSIPAELTHLRNLKKLDVRNNQLSGAIPKFASSVSVLTDGNPQIGKSPSTGSSPPGASTGSSGSNNRTSSGSNAGGGGRGGGSRSKTWIAGIVIGVVALVLVAGLCYCYASRKRQRSTQSKISIRPSISLMVANMSNSGTSDGHVVEPPGNMVISIEVLRGATDNFSDENILGRGGFGVVYRGELHDGTKIAVKRMKAAKMNSMGLREFQAEIAVLSKVRHRHLVGFLGYCIDGGEKVVVYEYMSHGPLSLHLFEWADAGLRPLEWKQRLTVALDVARGVEYLHSLAQTSFIHRDLKTSNILLDDNMRAKVSDFGLVRRVPDGKWSVETRLAGTFGYLPPEYAGKHAVTPVRLIN